MLISFQTLRGRHPVSINPDFVVCVEPVFLGDDMADDRAIISTTQRAVEVRCPYDETRLRLGGHLDR